jgi:hypothetical protein
VLLSAPEAQPTAREEKHKLISKGGCERCARLEG